MRFQSHVPANAGRGYFSSNIVAFHFEWLLSHCCDTTRQLSHLASSLRDKRKKKCRTHHPKCTLSHDRTCRGNQGHLFVGHVTVSHFQAFVWWSMKRFARPTARSTSYTLSGWRRRQQRLPDTSSREMSWHARSEACLPFFFFWHILFWKHLSAAPLCHILTHCLLYPVECLRQSKRVSLPLEKSPGCQVLSPLLPAGCPSQGALWIKTQQQVTVRKGEWGGGGEKKPAPTQTKSS